jgi:hypothetical protein
MYSPAPRLKRFGDNVRCLSKPFESPAEGFIVLFVYAAQKVNPRLAGFGHSPTLSRPGLLRFLVEDM